MTATLTARVRRDLHVKLQFTKGTRKFLNVGNDRPNVSIAVHAFQHPQNSFADLGFVIPIGVENSADIPKTMVYLDKIQDGSKVIDHLRALLVKRNLTMAATEDADHLIRPFNATMSSEYREAAMDAVRNGKLRIMICTDAAGMGCDIPDIDVVVQWKLPKTLSSWIQRAGCVARGRGRSGIAVLLVERAAYSPDKAKPPGESAGATSTGKATVSANKSCYGRGRKSQKTQGGGSGSANAAKEIKEYAKAHGLERGGTKQNDEIPTGKQPTLDVEASDKGLSAFVQVLNVVGTSGSGHLSARIYDELYLRYPAVIFANRRSSIVYGQV
ncbi:hypothetical protein EUX98_g8320 [Antrodiella citrinella]|uniref:DNA 3'-5' helicase n=1 Tax=Antrodiella citrinella TaxID=2447956 RepID=A0A4S4M8F7_9APHY|nr:hypothetical protein EUX98_g8320 [Antrodiella citrinella]